MNVHECRWVGLISADFQCGRARHALADVPVPEQTENPDDEALPIDPACPATFESAGRRGGFVDERKDPPSVRPAVVVARRRSFRFVQLRRRALPGERHIGTDHGCLDHTGCSDHGTAIIDHGGTDDVGDHQPTDDHGCTDDAGPDDDGTTVDHGRADHRGADHGDTDHTGDREPSDYKSNRQPDQ